MESFGHLNRQIGFVSGNSVTHYKANMNGKDSMSSTFDSPRDLEIVTWAQSAVGDDRTSLSIAHAPLPVNMHGANATGLALVTNGDIGADLIQLGAGAGFAPHTHPGHHILSVVAGIGTITYDGRIRETRAGQTFLIEGEVPHAVGAITDHRSPNNRGWRTTQGD